MTFDDGIVRIYAITNGAAAGSKPAKVIRYIESYYFGYETLGFQRYYTALEAKQQISAVIDIPGWNPAISSAQNVAIMEDGLQYLIQLTQPTKDEDGLRVTRLTLERINQAYAVES